MWETGTISRNLSDDSPILPHERRIQRHRIATTVTTKSTVPAKLVSVSSYRVVTAY